MTTRWSQQFFICRVCWCALRYIWYISVSSMTKFLNQLLLAETDLTWMAELPVMAVLVDAPGWASIMVVCAGLPPGCESTVRTSWIPGAPSHQPEMYWWWFVVLLQSMYSVKHWLVHVYDFRAYTFLKFVHVISNHQDIENQNICVWVKQNVSFISVSAFRFLYTFLQYNFWCKVRKNDHRPLDTVDLWQDEDR